MRRSLSPGLKPGQTAGTSSKLDRPHQTRRGTRAELCARSRRPRRPAGCRRRSRRPRTASRGHHGARAHRSAIAHSTSPLASTHPTGPAYDPRSNGSSSPISPSAASRGSPAAAGRRRMERLDQLDDARRGSPEEASEPRREVPHVGRLQERRRGVPRQLAAEGTEHAGDRLHDDRVFLADPSPKPAARSAFARSSSGSPGRGRRPAGGFDRTSRPKRDTNSSGEAPTRMPSFVGAANVKASGLTAQSRCASRGRRARARASTSIIRAQAPPCAGRRPDDERPPRRRPRTRPRRIAWSCRPPKGSRGGRARHAVEGGSGRATTASPASIRTVSPGAVRRTVRHDRQRGRGPAGIEERDRPDGDGHRHRPDRAESTSESIRAASEIRVRDDRSGRPQPPPVPVRRGSRHRYAPPGRSRRIAELLDATRHPATRPPRTHARVPTNSCVTRRRLEPADRGNPTARSMPTISAVEEVRHRPWEVAVRGAIGEARRRSMTRPSRSAARGRREARDCPGGSRRGGRRSPGRTTRARLSEQLRERDHVAGARTRT